MRVVVLVKATVDSEAGFMPSTELISAMGAYNEELANAGIMLDGDGFKPTSQGVRIAFDGDSRTVVKGPFPNPNELVAGYWIWQVKDMDEAIEWAKRAPNPMPGPSDLEIRPLYEPEDFGAAFTEELREQDSQLRDLLADR
ncbi:MAG: YciI family protein [Chloroflexota bacterium]|nr:YciI family protein [Chloroflexota bacterium]